LGGRLGERRSLARLLDDVAVFVRSYVVVSPEQLTALALWVTHAHAIEAADVTPYLAVTSPAMRSGKTRLLEVLELLVPRPIRTTDR
jgi:hypothetical protein